MYSSPVIGRVAKFRAVGFAIGGRIALLRISAGSTPVGGNFGGRHGKAFQIV